MKIKSRFAPVLALLILAASAVMVAAHAELIDAQPAPGAELAESPAEIRLTFSEAIGPQSEILLFGEGFQAISGVEAQNDPNDPAVIFATLPALDSDNYTVQWTAMSDDGHEISGTYSFSVGAEVGESDHAMDAHSNSESTTTGSTPWSLLAIGLIGGALLLILVLRLAQGK